MQTQFDYDIVIVGGGLAGLVSAIRLANSCNVLLIEEKQYPHHKVCGEYISNEVIKLLQEIGVFPYKNGATSINKLELSTKGGKTITANLPLGGFGISRYTLDSLLFNAVPKNVTTIHDRVVNITFQNDHFKVVTQQNSTLTAPYVLGCYGKRSGLDKKLNRNFIKQKSSWLAVKAHYKYTFRPDTVALHNFEGGYCGLSMVEEETVNACYLTSYRSFKKVKDVSQFQRKVMSKNKYLKDFFDNARPMFDAPLTISQISFEKRSLVEDHIFMLGDAAGLIHPLCGNGMAMAIHSASIFSDLFIKHRTYNSTRTELESDYIKIWNATFSSRLRYGSYFQELLLNETASSLALSVAHRFPSLVTQLIKRTHGSMI